MKATKLIAMIGAVVLMSPVPIQNGLYSGSATVYAEGEAPGENQTDMTDAVKFTYSAWSMFSGMITFSTFDPEETAAAHGQSAVIRSEEELAAFLNLYLKDEAIKDLRTAYDSKFFDENVLLLHTYIDPYCGRVSDHKYSGAVLEDGRLEIRYTSSVDSAICKTYYFEVMQAVIAKDQFPDCTVEWVNTDVLTSFMAKVSIVDADTGELWNIRENADEFSFTCEFSSIENGQSSLTINKFDVIVFQNPYIWDEKANLKIDSVSDFSVTVNKLPAGYEVNPEDCRYTVCSNNAIEAVIPMRYKPMGDVNADSEFTIADAVALQKWLLAVPDAELADWKAGDFSKDGRLDAVDFSLMIRALIGETVKTVVMPEVISDYQMPMYVICNGLKMYLGPDMSYPVIDTIPLDTRLTEIGFQKEVPNWVFTEFDGKNGWIRLLTEDNLNDTVQYEMFADKPVIYLYPETETDVHVGLELTESELSTTYPKYQNGWDVTAYPDGSLFNKADGTHHRYLFWDAKNCRTRYDFSEGFCVAGSDTESFLREKLTYMGLTEEEMNEFIVYWLPRMEHNAYNLITFQGDAYTNSAKLNITPEPDSMLRVFMVYVPLDEAAEIAPQQLETFERKGFTVVEWGGSELNAAK